MPFPNRASGLPPGGNQRIHPPTSSSSAVNWLPHFFRMIFARIFVSAHACVHLSLGPFVAVSGQETSGFCPHVHPNMARNKVRNIHSAPPAGAPLSAPPRARTHLGDKLHREKRLGRAWPTSTARRPRVRAYVRTGLASPRRRPPVTSRFWLSRARSASVLPG